MRSRRAIGSRLALQHAGAGARHSNIQLTADTYGHLEIADLRDAMEMLGEATGVMPDALEAEVLARSESFVPGPTGGPSVAGRQKRRARVPGES
jgi:hypothetical protein